MPKAETFNDGIVYLYEVDEKGKMQDKPAVKLRFQNRVVGEMQYYTAKAADVKIDRRIRTPMYKKIDDEKADCYYAVIEKTVYKIKRAQHYQDTIPCVTDLTLQCIQRRS